MGAFRNSPMPWQRDFLGVACELDPATGLYWYTKVILILPRQGGKTSTSRGKVTHRALTTKNARILYTAQDRNKALKRLEENFWLPIQDSPLKTFMGKPRWQAGSEALRWKNGAKLSIDAISKKTGHGDTLHEAHLDEAYAHRDNTIEGGIGPTMATVPGAQRWVTSAAGNLESLYLMAQRDMGRALVDSGVESRTLYWEFSAPEDADPDDPETALSAHPAIGHTISLDFVMNELQTDPDPAEVRRAYLGWWPSPKAPPAVIPAEAWRACYAPDPEDCWDGTPLWTVDVALERDWTSIGIAGKATDPEARCFVELVHREEGTEWAVSKLTRLAEKHGGWKVALDAGGGAASLIPDLEDAGFEVVKMPAAQRAAACTGFYDDALAGALRTLENTDVTEARKSAAKVGRGESWVFSRGKSMQDITALYALIVARWAWIETREADYDIMQSFY
jgi:phage terminase large subunit-like protein